jgi:YegS/Rv2252/BmrU family lipid kinase
MLYAKVIVNPLARGGVSRIKWPLIHESLKHAGLSFNYAFTEGTGHGSELAREAVEEGYELVIAVGGDGTVNEVVNGLVDESGRGRATLGIISAGTVGDFSHSLGIPRDVFKSCRLFSNFKRTTVDLGCVEYMKDNQRRKRFYINTAGLGFVTDVVGGTDRRLKFIGGTIPYVIGLIPTVKNYSNKDIILSIDGESRRERDFVVVVNNGRYLGGGKVFPDADPCDGLLDVVIVGNMSKLEALWSFPRFYTGTHAGCPKINLCKARSVSVESLQPLPIQMDGEVVGELPASFQVVPSALDVATQ